MKIDDKQVIKLLRELMAKASDDDYRFIYKMALLAFLCDRNGYTNVIRLMDEIKTRRGLSDGRQAT